ncbi:MAG: DUF3108 domain-containing protein [Rhizobium sp.]|jgi:hypothetical protein|nr:DUF3108 domain-containing protein [Rhizobium sp.]
MTIRYLPLLAVLGLAAPSPASAEPLRHRADFDIQLAGLPFARASFTSVRDDNLYEIEVNFQSAGVGQVVSDMTAELMSSGVIAKSGLQSQRYYLQYRKGERHRRFEADFKDGDVIATRVEPPRDRSKQRNWIPVSASDLKAVTDPLAGLIQLADSDPCKPVIPVYDGESRLDINLDRKGEEPFKTEGFDGTVVVCAMRYTPLAGYRKGSREAEFLKRLKRMEIWFAKSDRMNVYAPVFFSVPTRFGTLTMKATRFDG